VKGKVVVITGATSGVGRASAIELARRGANLLIIARHRGRAGEVERQILALRAGGTVRTFLADLSSLVEIRRIARELLDNAPRIDVLLNNAGVVERSRTTTVDGYETMFATNYLAYYLLTRLLLDGLRQSSPARIVNVASEAHRFGALDLNDLQSNLRFRAFPVYGKSKLADLMFTYELARRLEGSGVTVNALHPGWVATNLGLQKNDLLSRVVGAVSRICARTPERGAETAVWLASSPEVEGLTGKYFQDRRELQSNAASRDLQAQRDLWDTSARMVGLQP
jgi:NAD(P)-dependent dehydrogenase (short-subunit alcohol dehydrogenase family)